MCYDIKASLEAQLKRARRDDNLKAIEEIMERLVPLTDLPIHHASGFSHPELLIYTNRSPDFPEVATWGLIPHWIEDESQQTKFWNNTLNARGETIFDKPAFRESAQHYRCLVYVDGFYEHHHFQGKTYPFYIYRKDAEPLILAGLYSEWRNPDTRGVINSFSIVTTEGNALLSKIHNNPKLKAPRMPLILEDSSAEDWLQDIESTSEADIKSLIKKYPTEALKAHTVSKLRGKAYKGNVEDIANEVLYAELDF